MPPMASRPSRIAYVFPGSRLQVVAGADAGEAGADDEDVDVRGGLGGGHGLSRTRGGGHVQS